MDSDVTKIGEGIGLFDEASYLGNGIGGEAVPGCRLAGVVVMAASRQSWYFKISGSAAAEVSAEEKEIASSIGIASRAHHITSSSPSKSGSRAHERNREKKSCIVERHFFKLSPRARARSRRPRKPLVVVRGTHRKWLAPDGAARPSPLGREIIVMKA